MPAEDMSTGAIGLSPEMRYTNSSHQEIPGGQGGLVRGPPKLFHQPCVCAFRLSFRCGEPSPASPRSAQQKKRTETSPMCRGLSACASVSASMNRRGQDRCDQVYAVLRQDNRTEVAWYAV